MFLPTERKTISSSQNYPKSKSDSKSNPTPEIQIKPKIKPMPIINCCHKTKHPEHWIQSKNFDERRKTRAKTKLLGEKTQHLRSIWQRAFKIKWLLPLEQIWNYSSRFNQHCDATDTRNGTGVFKEERAAFWISCKKCTTDRQRQWRSKRPWQATSSTVHRLSRQVP